MHESKISFIHDIRTNLIITISVTAFLQFGLLGSFGLAFYGILIAYGMIFLIANYKTIYSSKGPALYLISSFYLYYLICTFVTGNYTRYAASVILLLFISINSFIPRSNEQRIEDLLVFGKIIAIFSLIMALSSIVVSIIFVYFHALVIKLPYNIQALMADVAEAFPARMSGFTSNANTTASYCIIASIFSVFAISLPATNIKWKIIHLCNIIVTLITSAFFVASRTQTLAFGVFLISYCLIFFLFVNKKNKRMRNIFKIILISCLVLGVICIIILLLSESIRDFFLNHVLRISTLKTMTGRIGVYKNALILSFENPVFGYNYHELAKATQLQITQAHNVFLEALSFAGVPGLILFTAYFVLTIYIAIKNLLSKEKLSHQENILNCFLLSYIAYFFIFGLFEPADIDTSRLTSVCYPILFGCIHGIQYNLAQQKTEKTHSKKKEESYGN